MNRAIAALTFLALAFGSHAASALETSPAGMLDEMRTLSCEELAVERDQVVRAMALTAAATWDDWEFDVWELSGYGVNATFSPADAWVVLSDRYDAVQHAQLLGGCVRANNSWAWLTHGSRLRHGAAVTNRSTDRASARATRTERSKPSEPARATVRIKTASKKADRSAAPSIAAAAPSRNMTGVYVGLAFVFAALPVGFLISRKPRRPGEAKTLRDRLPPFFSSDRPSAASR